MLGRGVLSRLHTLTQQKTQTLTVYVDIDQNKQSNRKRGYLVQAEAMLKELRAEHGRSQRLDAAAEASCAEAVRLLQQDLEEQPRNPFLLAMLAEAATLVGDGAGAARQLELAREIGLDDAVEAADLAVGLAWLEMLGGDLDTALNHLGAVLQTPARISAAVLRGSAEWAPLREHPRFQQLLASAQST